MPKETTDGIKLPSLDELFSSEEERKEAKLKRIEEIPLELIDPFPDHPFKVKDDEDMENLIESIRAKGVLTPCMVRKKKDGRYELISGHRRKRACSASILFHVRLWISQRQKLRSSWSNRTFNDRKYYHPRKRSHIRCGLRL